MQPPDNENGARDNRDGASAKSARSPLGVARPDAVPAVVYTSGMRRRACTQLTSVVVGILAITFYIHLGPKPAERVLASLPSREGLPELPPDGPKSDKEDLPAPVASGTTSPATDSASVVAAPAPPPSVTAPKLDRAKLAAAEDVARRRQPGSCQGGWTCGGFRPPAVASGQSSGARCPPRSKAGIPGPRPLDADRAGIGSWRIPPRRA